MENGPKTAVFALLMLTSALVLTSGCFDINSAKRILYPEEERTYEMVRGTIADVRYEFKGALSESPYPIGQDEFVRRIDNFYIGEAGGTLYVIAQVHFFLDSSGELDFDRYIVISLYMEVGGEMELVTTRRYDAMDSERVDANDRIATIAQAEPGLWSLRVEGHGSRVSGEGEEFYDWFHVSVNGIYSEDSYNNNKPAEV